MFSDYCLSWILGISTCTIFLMPNTVLKKLTGILNLLLLFLQSFSYLDNKRQKDCLWKQRTHYGLENRSLDFIETLPKQ